MTEAEKPIEEVYFFWMERAMKAQRKATNQLFRKLGIELTPDQWIVLKKLSETEVVSQRELADATSKDPAALTRLLDLLEKKRLIERASADRRTFKVLLTKEGLALVNKVIPEAVAYRQIGIKNVSEMEMSIFRKVLETIHHNFSELS